MKTPLSNSQIIQKLKYAAAVLEVTDTSPQKVFRVRAYNTAIESIENLDEELSVIIKKQSLEKIKGIGKELAQKITDLISTGESKSLNKLYNQVPAGMFPLLNIPTLGPKKAHRLSVTFKLDQKDKAISSLKEHLKSGQVASLERFGEVSAQKILNNIDTFKPKTTRMRLDEAQKLASQVINLLKPIKSIQKIEVLGSLRRQVETIGDVDIGISTNSPQEIVDHLQKNSNLSIKASGSNIIRLVMPGNKQIDLKFTTPDKWGSMLQHFTGSKAHNVALRELALKKNLSLSEHGIKDRGELKTFSSEKEFYSYIDLPLIPPELREGQDEIKAALNSSLPNLITLNDIKGETHTHSDFIMISSHDTGMAPADLFTFCQQSNYQWVMVGDHNPSQKNYQDDKMEQVILERNRYIEDEYYSWKAKHEKSTLKVFTALEIDISKDGDLALEPSIYKHLDVLIGAVHSSFDLSQKDQTQRLLTALTNYPIKILSHPTTRIINGRNGIAVDWPKIFTLCRKKHIALEINAAPKRLDFPDSLVQQAIQAGVKLSIGTDAHSKEGLENIKYGISVARRGWVEKNDMINTYSAKQLVKWLKS